LLEIGITLYYGYVKGQDNGSGAMIVDHYDSPYIFKSKPRTSISIGGVEYHFNNYSMRRNSDVTEAPKKGVRRLLSYGDSISQGWGVKSEETYPQVLESELNGKQHHKYEVFNMFRGTAPTIASFHIRRDIEQFKPFGIIIEIELLNDTSDEALIRTTGRDRNGLPLKMQRSRYILGWDGELLASLTLQGSFIERTKIWSYLSRLVGFPMSFVKDGAWKKGAAPLFSDDSGVFFYNMQFDRFLLTEPALEKGFDRMFESLHGIHRLLERKDIRFLVVILPSRFVYVNGRFKKKSLEQVRKAEVRAAELHLPYVSLYEHFKEAGGENLFMDFCHPTGDGNRVIAHSIFPLIIKW
jgi:lysophospholipase L1-like esterase